jgi:hypothetical protein
LPSAADGTPNNQLLTGPSGGSLTRPMIDHARRHHHRCTGPKAARYPPIQNFGGGGVSSYIANRIGTNQAAPHRISQLRPVSAG